MKRASAGEELFELNTCDPEDIEDIFPLIENSFQIKFDRGELKGIKTFGQLCDTVTDKIGAARAGGCTSQQAFYKFRKAVKTLAVKEVVTPGTNLKLLIPRRNRRANIKKIEAQLGCSLNILQPADTLTVTLILLFIASIISLFFIFQIAFPIVVLTVIGLKLSSKYGKELTLKTVHGLVKKMSSEHYLQCRSVSNTFNPDEIVPVVQRLFHTRLGIAPSMLTRNAAF